MKEAWNFARCVSVLTGEIELLKKISVAQNTVRQAVLNREWEGFEEKTAEVNRLSEEFALLENERVRLFSALPSTSNKSESSFYSSILGLPVEESRLLSRLYRELKMETQKIRALNEGFLAYLDEAKNLATAFIEALYPARGGKLYTRKGQMVSRDLRSIVINNSF